MERKNIRAFCYIFTITIPYSYFRFLTPLVRTLLTEKVRVLREKKVILLIYIMNLKTFYSPLQKNTFFLNREHNFKICCFNRKNDLSRATRNMD